MSDEVEKAIWTYEELVYKDLPEVWHSPSLLPDFQKGLDVVIGHIDANNTIALHGDKDSDGINGVATLTRIMLDIGVNVIPYPPSRDEGYGLQAKQVHFFYDQGASLIITIDNGSLAYKAMKVAKELGIDLVVTDHHDVDDEEYDIPVINPKRPGNYPFQGICGTVVALKLGQALLDHYGFPESYWKKYLDYAAVATIGDVMPLVGENRWIVKEGLKQLNNNPSPGYAKLIESSSFLVRGKISEREIGWNIAPALAATGRIDTPMIGFDLLAKENMDGDQEVLAVNDCQKRKFAVMKDIGDNPEIKPKDYPIVFLHEDSIPEGLIGLYANRLVNQYQRPAICVTRVNLPGLLKGSCRSIAGVSMRDFIMSLPKMWFEDRGGHPTATGFTICEDFLDEFEHACETYVLEKSPMSYTYNEELEISQIGEKKMQEIESKKPYGKDYPAPVSLIRNFFVKGLRTYGEKLYGKAERDGFSASICFDKDAYDKKVISYVDAIGTLERSKQGEVRFNVLDWRVSE